MEDNNANSLIMLQSIGLVGCDVWCEDKTRRVCVTQHGATQDNGRNGGKGGI